jgi:tetrapyrrole methylase family protein/MazG family protein
VLEAIHLDDGEKLKEELGDLLLQVVLNAQVAKDADQFDIEDVAQTINEKMVRRHPHVFGEGTAATAEQVLAQWDELKEQERKHKPQSYLDGVPATLPALLKAFKISEKAVGQGFEWNDESEIWQQLDSELAEFREATQLEKQGKDREEKEKLKTEMHLEMGDILFTLVNIARWHDLNCEESLLMSIEKFKGRFYQMERSSPKPLKELTPGEWGKLWIEAKDSAG